jgi:hypothetical protein
MCETTRRRVLEGRNRITLCSQNSPIGFYLDHIFPLFILILSSLNL